MAVDIRGVQPGDMDALAGLYSDAFPNEDLLPLVRDLTALGDSVVSRVALDGEQLLGHVMFTRCGLAGRDEHVGLLGPLAVASSRQRQGIGSRLVRHGVAGMADWGVTAVLVLGDPAYYQRFGFVPCHDVLPPYPLPEEWRGAWQVLRLDGAAPPLAGQVRPPDVWLNPALWAP